MAHRPARLPASEADLADWSVYADELLSEGNPLGEPLAHELSLPVEIDDVTAEALQRQWSRRCWRNRVTMEVAWTLGHARTLELRPRMMVRTPNQAIDDGTFASARDFVASDAGQVLESISFSPQKRSKLQRRVLAALPSTCRRLNIGRLGRWNSAELTDFVDDLPPQITELDVHSIPDDLASCLVTDRFALVRIIHDAGAVEPALAATRDVRVELFRRAGPLSQPRLGYRADVGCIDGSKRRSGFVLESQGLAVQQRRFGFAPVRTQLAGQLPEMFHPWHVDTEGITFVRRGTSWTLRSALPLVVDGQRLEVNEIVGLRDGATIGRAGLAWIFVARDLEQRYRELVG